MNGIDRRARHGAVLVLVLAVCVAVFSEQSYCGERKLIRKGDLTITDKVPTQMRAVDRVLRTAKQAAERLASLKGNLLFRPSTAEQEYDKLLQIIEVELNKDAREVQRDIDVLEAAKEKLSADVEDRRKEIKGLEDTRDSLSEQMESLESQRADLLGQVDKLQGQVGPLKEQVDTLQSTKNTLIAWFGGGMTTSVAGIVLLVLKITSQKKDIKLKQIEIDKKSKKKG